jgi:NodT family efflux transporter outer membrane factor (OMF) lipoprotein
MAVPSEMLRQRPDIRAAEHQVAAANANIGVATAAFFPSFSINASSGLSAANLTDLLQASALVWSIGSSATAPITRGKLLKAQQQAAIADHQAVSAEYRQTVLEAIREVENALQGASILERRQRAQDQALVAARKTLDLSAKRFKSGLVSFLDVVDAERTRLDAERAANAIRAERLAISVSLIKALGGEW